MKYTEKLRDDLKLAAFIMNIVIGFIFIILGNYLPKIKRNYTIMKSKLKCILI